MCNLIGKRILLFMPKFFCYSDMIIKELQQKGATVDFVENKTHKFDYASPSAKLRCLRKVYHYIRNTKWKYALNAIDWDVKYDVFFVINGASYDRRIINKLRERNPQMKSVLYLWDSTQMFNWIGIEKDFDKSFTFDPLDAQTLGIEYLANMYPIDVSLSDSKPTLDVFFIGTQHADRFEVISKIYANMDAGTTSFIKLLIKYRTILHNKFIYWSFQKVDVKFARNYVLNYELVERKVKAEFLVYSPILLSVITGKMKEARCVLDIQSSFQVGLTHQMMSALAMGKKVITTNKWVVNYDFYDPKQILVIDRDNPIIDTDFLMTDYIPIQIHDSIKRSRIDNWITTILN